MAVIDLREKRALVRRVDRMVKEGVPVTKACFLLGTTYNTYKRAKLYLANPQTVSKYKQYKSPEALVIKVESLIESGMTVEAACEKAKTYPRMYYKAKKHC